jgi:hypothetical protein
MKAKWSVGSAEERQLNPEQNGDGMESIYRKHMDNQLDIYFFLHNYWVVGSSVVFYIGGTPKQLSALPKGINFIGANSSQKKIYTVGSALEKGLGKTE